MKGAEENHKVVSQVVNNKKNVKEEIILSQDMADTCAIETKQSHPIWIPVFDHNNVYVAPLT